MSSASPLRLRLAETRLLKSIGLIGRSGPDGMTDDKGRRPKCIVADDALRRGKNQNGVGLGRRGIRRGVKPFQREEAEPSVLRYPDETARGERPAAALYPHEDLDPRLTLDEGGGSGWRDWYCRRD